MPNASELDKAKYDVCQSISRYKRINKLTPVKLAHKLGINQTKTDDILFGRINEFNFEELTAYTEKLNGETIKQTNYPKKKVFKREGIPYLGKKYKIVFWFENNNPD